MDVGNAIGITRQHKSLLEYVAQELVVTGSSFDNLTAAQKEVVPTDAEERYTSYAFLHQSGKQHAKLKTDFQNDFTTGNNHSTPRLDSVHFIFWISTVSLLL